MMKKITACFLTFLYSIGFFVLPALAAPDYYRYWDFEMKSDLSSVDGLVVGANALAEIGSRDDGGNALIVSASTNSYKHSYTESINLTPQGKIPEGSVIYARADIMLSSPTARLNLFSVQSPKGMSFGGVQFVDGAMLYRPSGAKIKENIAVGEWMTIGFRFKTSTAEDASGLVTVYLNGTQIFESKAWGSSASPFQMDTIRNMVWSGKTENYAEDKVYIDDVCLSDNPEILAPGYAGEMLVAGSNLQDNFDISAPVQIQFTSAVESLDPDCLSIVGSDGHQPSYEALISENGFSLEITFLEYLHYETAYTVYLAENGVTSKKGVGLAEAFEKTFLTETSSGTPLVPYDSRWRFDGESSLSGVAGIEVGSGLNAVLVDDGSENGTAVEMTAAVKAKADASYTNSLNLIPFGEIPDGEELFLRADIKVNSATAGGVVLNMLNKNGAPYGGLQILDGELIYRPNAKVIQENLPVDEWITLGYKVNLSSPTDVAGKVTVYVNGAEVFSSSAWGTEANPFYIKSLRIMPWSSNESDISGDKLYIDNVYVSNDAGILNPQYKPFYIESTNIGESQGVKDPIILDFSAPADVNSFRELFVQLEGGAQTPQFQWCNDNRRLEISFLEKLSFETDYEIRLNQLKFRSEAGVAFSGEDTVSFRTESAKNGRIYAETVQNGASMEVTAELVSYFDFPREFNVYFAVCRGEADGAYRITYSEKRTILLSDRETLSFSGNLQGGEFIKIFVWSEQESAVVSLGEPYVFIQEKGENEK